MERESLDVGIASLLKALDHATGALRDVVVPFGRVLFGPASCRFLPLYTFFILTKDGNGEFPVGFCLPIPVPTGEKFPRPRPCQGSRGTISPHPRTQAGKHTRRGPRPRYTKIYSTQINYTEEEMSTIETHLATRNKMLSLETGTLAYKICKEIAHKISQIH